MLFFLPNIITIVHASSQVTLNPTSDTYVDSSNPNSNYGGQDYLQIQYYPEDGIYGDCMIWLQFNLPSIPSGETINEATLQLYTDRVDETFNVTACYCPENSWTELGITWNNVPSLGVTPLDSVLVGTNYQWYSWDVSYAFQYLQPKNLTAVTIVLLELNAHSSATSVWFESKEAPVNLTDYAPKLTIQWSAVVVPEFPTFLIIPLTMIVILIALTFYKKKAIPYRRHG